MVTTYHRNLFAVIVTMTGATFSYSFSYPLIGLMLERRGYDSTLIGLNTAVEAVSIFAVAPFAPYLLRRLGTIGLMLAAVALRLSGFIVIPVIPDPDFWLVARFFMGAGAGLMWIVSEAWINNVVPEHARGRMLALYSMAISAGYALGPLALAQTGNVGWMPFLIGTAILFGAGLSTLVARGRAPRLDGSRSASLARYVFLAPLVMLSVFVVSALDNMLVTFLPVYGPTIGVTVERALYLLTVMGLGGIVLQVPVGWLADRIDRRFLTLAIALGLFGACLALPWVVGRAPFDLAFMFVLGGLIGTLYTMGNVLMGERFRGGDLAAASTVFAVMWSLGALLGPPTGGFGMDIAPVFGLPAAMTLMVLPILPVGIAAYIRRRR